jgi:hypothetical protein
MELVPGPWALLLICASLALSATLVAVSRWIGIIPACTIDAEPHTLTLLGPNGRCNPAQYENFPDYRAAQARQRALIRNGRASIVAHSATGEIRIDPTMLPGCYDSMLR